MEKMIEKKMEKKMEKIMEKKRREKMSIGEGVEKEELKRWMKIEKR
ncbi:hypothetical protein LAUMK15_05740 [Mycobacterium persicum]|nr:hypothetical protein LAUMK15_05740 [Mycobacterium persicum]